MYSAIAILGTFVAIQFAKKFIIPKYGSTGLHIFGFAIACVAVIFKSLMTAFPSFSDFMVQSAGYLAGAITFYEVIMRQVFKANPITDLETPDQPFV